MKFIFKILHHAHFQDFYKRKKNLQFHFFFVKIVSPLLKNRQHSFYVKSIMIYGVTPWTVQRQTIKQEIKRYLLQIHFRHWLMYFSYNRIKTDK